MERMGPHRKGDSSAPSQGQLDAFEILRENIHALLATGYRPTPVFQSFKRLKGLLDRPIVDVRMDELYALDEDDRRSFVLSPQVSSGDCR